MKILLFGARAFSSSLLQIAYLYTPEVSVHRFTYPKGIHSCTMVYTYRSNCINAWEANKRIGEYVWAGGKLRVWSTHWLEEVPEEVPFLVCKPVCLPMVTAEGNERSSVDSCVLQRLIKTTNAATADREKHAEKFIPCKQFRLFKPITNDLEGIQPLAMYYCK